MALLYTNILIFVMLSTCFEAKGLSSGRWLYVPPWYSVFYVLQLQKKKIVISACKTYCTILVRTAVFLKMNRRVFNV